MSGLLLSTEEVEICILKLLVLFFANVSCVVLMLRYSSNVCATLVSVLMLLECSDILCECVE